MCKSAVFPHQRMAENQPKRTLVFHGERMMWISPVTLDELQDLKAAHPKAPLVVGNTGVGMYSQNVFCYHIFSVHPWSGAKLTVYFAFSALFWNCGYGVCFSV